VTATIEHERLAPTQTQSARELMYLLLCLLNKHGYISTLEILTAPSDGHIPSAEVTVGDQRFLITVEEPDVTDASYVMVDGSVQEAMF
jgi:hypothetical protein